MADTDKLVKVGQLDTIVDEIVDKFGETNGRLVNKADKITSTVSGTTVEFEAEKDVPITGALVDLSLKQSGSGTPSPTNIRPINPYAGASVELNGTAHAVTFSISDSFYAGTYDFVTGVLTGLYEVIELQNKTDGWQNITHNGLPGVRGAFPSLKANDKARLFMCSHLANAGVTLADIKDDSIVNRAQNYYNIFIASTSNFTNATEMLEWATAQKNNGTPVQFAYALADPVVYQITGIDLTTIDGSNTCSSADGNITVTFSTGLDVLKSSLDKNIHDTKPLVNNVSNVLKNIKSRYICHLGVYKTNDIITPCQSLADIRRAKRLGFDAIELNVRKTSDGKYVCLHGSGGKFGAWFKDVNGNSVSDVAVFSMTLADIQSSIRYISKYKKYQTAPPTLQEALYECKKLGIVPFVEYQSAYTDEIDILDSIMGKNNYCLGTYATDRGDLFDAPMFSWLTITSPNALVEKCEASGGAYVAGINVINSAYSSFTADDWKDLVNAVHSAGYLLSYAYAGEALNQLLIQCGFDFNSTSANINPLENGNIVDIPNTPLFTGFTTSGTISEGNLTLDANETIYPSASIPSVFLGGMTLRIVFSGTISLNMGANISGTFTGDGKTEMCFSTFVEENAPTFVITAESKTTIMELSFKSSEM